VAIIGPGTTEKFCNSATAQALTSFYVEIPVSHDGGHRDPSTSMGGLRELRMLCPVKTGKGA
jgi:hypothetical protein